MLPNTRIASLRAYQQIEIDAKAKGAETWRQAERWLGLNDLFYLMVRLLRRPDFNKDWLFDRCREIQAAPDGHLDLWAREHGKSSAITFGLTIQDILRDPEITIGIFSHTRPVAKSFLGQIKREFEDNEWLKYVFSDVLWENPSRESPRWSEDAGLIVRRKSNPKEATVEAHGLVDGQPTGRHFRLRVYDDVVTRESVTTPEMVQKVTDAWDLSQNLGMQAEQGGKVRYIGTRYCLTADARILMSDWTHKRIADVAVGDVVVGWVLRDGKRWLVPSKVLHRGIHPHQPVNRYTFSNGRSVVCTPDHRWWRGKGWSSKGKGQTGSRGNEYSALGFGYHQSKHIHELLIPTHRVESRDAAWLAGFYDGEGTVAKNKNHPSGCVVFVQSEKNQPLIDYANDALDRMGFVSRTWKGENATGNGNTVHHIYVNGGWRERYRFLAEVAPIRRDKIAATLMGQLKTDRLKLEAIDHAGMADVHWIETETVNYVAEGFCSKNSLHDTYAEIITRGAAIPRIYPATHNGRLDGRPVLFSEDEWALRVRNSRRSILAAQMLQNPMADSEATFRVEWLRSYEVRPRTLNVYIMADPSRGRSSDSDNTAIAVIGVAANGAKFLLDGARHRMTLSQRWVALRGLYHKWRRTKGVQHIAVGYERYGAQSDDEYFQEQMQLEYRAGNRDAHFPIVELNWPRDGTQSKRERVERLEPDFRNSRFYLPLPVYAEVAGKKGPAVWSVSDDPESKDFGIVRYDRSRGLTRMQLDAVQGGSADLLAAAIRGIDQDGQVYDLTVAFHDEYANFPFGRLKDLIDSTSRIFDMEPTPPTLTSKEATEPMVHWDA